MENTNKMDLRQRKVSLKTKLMSALSLLLVSTILLGTSTYAWFVLSTAPEVTGMSTTVGSNGSLEIALQHSNELGTDPARAVIQNPSMGGSVSAGKNKVEANETWGNILYLDDSSYGFTEMLLYPARLNISEADGAQTVNKEYPLLTAAYGVDGRVAAANKQLSTGVYSGGSYLEGFGVRGIGNFSETTQEMDVTRMTLINKAKTDIPTLTNGMASAIGSVFNGNLMTLNSVGSLGDSDLLSTSQTQSVLNIIRAVQTQAENQRQALGLALMAQHAANLSHDFGEPESYAALVAQYRNMTCEQIAADAEASEDLKAAANALAPTITALTNAVESVNTSASANNGQAVASAAKSAVRSAMNYTALTFVSGGNTYTWDELGTGAQAKLTKIQELLDADENTYAYLNNQAGAMATLADIAGDYNFRLTVANNLTVYVTANSSFDAANPSTGRLAGIVAAFGTVDAAEVAFSFVPTGFVGTPYGMAIDLAFRSNSAGDLLLSEAAMRANTTDTALQGGGSTMDFGVAELNEAVYVVFYGTDSGELYGVAKYNDGKLVMAESEIVDGVLTVGDVKADQKIASLAANTELYVTALVYLDGDKIDEAPAGNVMGTLNLQFAHSASLQGMVNNDWVGGSGAGAGGGAGEGGETPASTDLVVTATPGSIAMNGSTTLSATLNDEAVTGVTYTVSGEASDYELSGNTLTIYNNGTYTVTGSYTDGEGTVHTGTVQVTVS